MELKVGQDLKPVHDLLRQLRRNFPQHGKMLRAASNNVDTALNRYHQHIWQFQRRPHERYLDDAQKILDEISTLLTELERAAILGYLSGQARSRDED